MQSVKLGSVPEEAKQYEEDQDDLIRFNEFLEYYESKEADKKRIAQGKKPREKPNKKLRTEAAYCVGGEVGKVKGSLTISSNIIYFSYSLARLKGSYLSQNLTEYSQI